MARSEPSALHAARETLLHPSFVIAGLDPAITQPNSSLPGLTRQSIHFGRILQRSMDARVKPAHDAEFVAPSCSIRFTFSNSQAPAFSRRARVELLVCLPSNHEGRRSAERRVVNKPRRIPGSPGTEAHGNAFRRSAAAS